MLVTPAHDSDMKWGNSIYCIGSIFSFFKDFSRFSSIGINSNSSAVIKYDEVW